jgi:hypothetical protein
LVQKIATNLIYIEQGQAYTFDRLSAFEEWLNRDTVLVDSTQVAVGSPQPERRGGQSLSKNKRDQLMKEVTQLEERITVLESELAELEFSFQNPATGTDWESTHQRYAQLKTTLDRLYEDLARRWELIG